MIYFILVSDVKGNKAVWCAAGNGRGEGGACSGLGKVKMVDGRKERKGREGIWAGAYLRRCGRGGGGGGGGGR